MANILGVAIPLPDIECLQGFLSARLGSFLYSFSTKFLDGEAGVGRKGYKAPAVWLQ
jgi:hypothetical protein